MHIIHKKILRLFQKVAGILNLLLYFCMADYIIVVVVALCPYLEQIRNNVEK